MSQVLLCDLRHNHLCTSTRWQAMGPGRHCDSGLNVGVMLLSDGPGDACLKRLTVRSCWRKVLRIL